MIKNKIIQFYGNRGFILDFVISLVSLLIMTFVTSKIIFSYNSEIVTSLINFLGIIAGFMLTAFSLLLLYNPKEEESPKFNRLRKSNAFKKSLKYFISTIIIILLSVAILFVHLINQEFILKWIGSLLVILSFLMMIRCLYYLFAIIDFE